VVVNTPLPPEVIDDIRRPRTPEADRTGPVIGLPHHGAAWHDDPDATAWGDELNRDLRRHGVGLRLGVELQESLAREEIRQFRRARRRRRTGATPHAGTGRGRLPVAAAPAGRFRPPTVDVRPGPAPGDNRGRPGRRADHHRRPSEADRLVLHRGPAQAARRTAAHRAGHLCSERIAATCSAHVILGNAGGRFGSWRRILRDPSVDRLAAMDERGAASRAEVEAGTLARVHCLILRSSPEYR
jgi:hypothetical protein